MKAEEVMLGDWIAYIPEIEEGEDSYLGEPRPIQVNMSSFTRMEELIFAPIPITPEILEKNGFEVEEEVDDVSIGLCNCYSIDNDSVVIFWADSYDTMTCAGTEDFVKEQWRMEVFGQGCLIEKNSHKPYVHELQHALRLCGLWELADNIKVE